MIELERTYLAKMLPLGIKKCRYKEIIDIYYPEEAIHSKNASLKDTDIEA